jgi:hypothetical protein
LIFSSVTNSTKNFPRESFSLRLKEVWSRSRTISGQPAGKGGLTSLAASDGIAEIEWNSQSLLCLGSSSSTFFLIRLQANCLSVSSMTTRSAQGHPLLGRAWASGVVTFAKTRQANRRQSVPDPHKPVLLEVRGDNTIVGYDWMKDTERDFCCLAEHRRTAFVTRSAFEHGTGI